MTGRLTLESFDPRAQSEDAIEIDASEFEEAKLAAFEKGYQAGWDDSVAAQNTETARLHEGLGRNLQELSFTFLEARRHVLDALRPLLIDMSAKVLPALARDSLARIVAEQLMPIAENLASAPIAVVANPVAIPQIKEMLGTQDGLPLTFEPEPTLGEGQVYLRFTETETRIDLDAVIEAISEAVNTYFNSDSEEPADD